MKRQSKVAIAVCGVLGALAFAVLLSQPIQAGELTPSSCMFAAIQGSYEFVAPATVTIGPGTVIALPERLLYTSPAPYASKGSLMLDDAGHVQLEAVEGFNGVLDHPTTVTGIYALESGCTAAVLFDNGARLGLRIMDNGRMTYLVSTTPGFVILRSAGP